MTQILKLLQWGEAGNEIAIQRKSNMQNRKLLKMNHLQQRISKILLFQVRKRIHWVGEKKQEKVEKKKENGQTSRRATILSWLIDCDVIQENAEVLVIEGDTRKKQGKIKK